MRSTKWVAVLAAAALSFGVAACGSDNNSSSSSTGSSGPQHAAPAARAARSRCCCPSPRPRATSRRTGRCSRPSSRSCAPTARSSTRNADQDAAKQQQQAEAALTKGAKVLVLDPVDSASAAAIVTRAKQSKVPVIAYDRLIANAHVDYYISFDNDEVGKLQGHGARRQAQDGRQDRGSIVMINGAPTDNNAALFKEGAHSVHRQQRPEGRARSTTRPTGRPDKAQAEMEQAITALGKNGFVGVYAANDGTAGGAIAAMKSDGVDPKPIPSTGQDAELAGIQRIVAGEQYMTVYKAIKPRGRGGRAARRRPAATARSRRAASSTADQQRPGRRPVGAAEAGRGDEGQHQRHGHQGRLLEGVADLHAASTRPRASRPASSRHVLREESPRWRRPHPCSSAGDHQAVRRGAR